MDETVKWYQKIMYIYILFNKIYIYVYIEIYMYI